MAISNSALEAAEQNLQDKEEQGWKMKMNVGRERRGWNKGTHLGKVPKPLQDLTVQVSIDDLKENRSNVLNRIINLLFTFSEISTCSLKH